MIELHRCEAGDFNGLVYVNADTLVCMQRIERAIDDARGDCTILILMGETTLKVEEPVDAVLELIEKAKRPPDRAASKSRCRCRRQWISMGMMADSLRPRGPSLAL